MFGFWQILLVLFVNVKHGKGIIKCAVSSKPLMVERSGPKLDLWSKYSLYIEYF